MGLARGVHLKAAVGHEEHVEWELFLDSVSLNGLLEVLAGLALALKRHRVIRSQLATLLLALVLLSTFFLIGDLLVNILTALHERVLVRTNAINLAEACHELFLSLDVGLGQCAEVSKGRCVRRAADERVLDVIRNLRLPALIIEAVQVDTGAVLGSANHVLALRIFKGSFVS